MPPFAPPNYFTYTPPGFGNMPSQFATSGYGSPGSYDTKDERQQWSSYQDNYLRPYLEYYMQSRNQAFSEAQNTAALAEQQWLNRMQNALAERAAGREDRAQGFGEMQANRTFGEDVRRFNEQAGLARDQFGYQRTQGDRQYGLDRRGMALQEYLGRGQLGLQNRQQAYTERAGDRQYGLDRSRFGLEAELGRGQLGLQRQQFGLEAELGRGRLGLDTELGRGRLGLDTRGQQLDDAYRNRALQQEADLMRERLNNEMTQSRYQAFGRSQAPNFRTMTSWR